MLDNVFFFLRHKEDVQYLYNEMSISEALGKVGRAAQAAPGQRQAPEYLDQYYEYQQQKDAYKRIK